MMQRDIQRGVGWSSLILADSSSFLLITLLFHSFSNPEDADIAQFFDKYGFVVIDGVLSAEECQESIDEFWG